MSLRLIYRQSVRAEVSAAARWFNSRQRGSGMAFRHAVDQCVAGIVAMPFRYAVHVDDVRFAQAVPYPYLVYYTVTPTRIYIVAVRHAARQDPAAGLGGDSAN